MKLFGLSFILLIVTSFLASLQAQSIIQCVENIPGNIRSDCGALIIPSVSDKEMTEEKNSSFKPSKKTEHIFLSQFSKGE
ncbi:MAG: hypothetical protein ABR503_12510, partial [Chitinophagaceae bacterium]